MIEREKGMPKWCYRRKDSPAIWYKFKVNGEVFCGPTEVEGKANTDKRLAEDIVTKLRNAALEGKVKAKACDWSLKKLIDTVLDKRKATDTYRRSILNVVEWFVGEHGKDLEAGDITPDMVNEYHHYRVKLAAESTCNRELGYFQSCIRYAIKKMKLNLEDPVAGWERFDEDILARDRVLTYEERARLLADPKIPQDMKDIYIWALQTGMRKGEILSAKWADINWADKNLKVKTSKKKKRGATANPYRYVPLNIYPMDILKRRRMEGWEKKSEFIFCDANGGKLSRHGQVTTALEYACAKDRCDIPDFRFHDFRHTFATDFLRANHDIKAIKALSQIMGHSEERITQRYTHLWPEDKGNQVALLPAIPGYLLPPPSYVRATQQKSA